MLSKIKIFTLAAVIAAFAAQQAFAATLPDVDGWICGEPRETKLETVSGSHGVWLEREYRTERGEKFLAILMEGAGPKLWKPVEPADGGEAPESESAEKISIAGHDAVIESRSVLGLSLVVKLGIDSVLTLESQYADKEELARAAEILIAHIEEEKASD